MPSERIQRRIDALVDEADRAITQSQWATVQDRTRNVLALDPGNADALAFLQAADRALAGVSSENGAGELTARTPASATAPAAVSATATSSVPAQPSSFAGGRYLVKKFLGEGGKKRVYLAHDTLLDRDVAFALIKTQGLDATGRARIQREAQAMGRLGDHPHIMPIYDIGQENEQPYMVLPLMTGGDVEGVVKKASDRKMPLQQALKIALETAKGLEFAHTKRVVHRDLKPGNVWLTQDGTAKIGDFGLAVAMDLSRMTTEGMMVGTVNYMPPEQALGGEVTPLSDLYSLGAMLYEMVTGRPPFLGDDPVAVISQHINTPPVAPTWHRPECPKPLEALIVRLLAKDPKERPASATDVRKALEAVDVSALSSSPVPQHGQPALDSMAGGVFVGRQKEMGELKAALEQALGGKGRLLTLVGEPGIGKTRTSQELATYAGLRGAQVLWGRCYEGTGTPAYWPWVQAIRSYVREKEPARLKQEMGAGAADIAEIISDVRERLPEVPRPVQLEPEAARFRFFDSIAAFLKGASKAQPLVLVLDDLHWADKSSLLLLEFVARELDTTRVLLIGTYRDMELSRQHPLAESLGNLTRERLFQRVLLRGLSEQDVARFIEIAAGRTPPDGLTHAVYEQTEGNPLFVTEVVRLLVQEEAFARTQATRQESNWTLRIPEGVREVIGRRLNRLSARCNETLTTAAVVGREFSVPVLARLVEDMSADRLIEVLEEALSARIIEELPKELGRYQFTHALIQETLVGELSLTRRVRLHAKIAEALEQLYGVQAEQHAAELAHHFGEAQALLGPDKVVRYCLLAGNRALENHAVREAIELFEQGLAAHGEKPLNDTAADVLSGLGAARRGLAEMTVALEHATRAFEYFVATGNLGKAMQVFRSPVGPQSEMGKLLARAIPLTLPGSVDAARLRALYASSFAAERSGTQREAERLLDEALAIARERRDTALEAFIHARAGATWFLWAAFDRSFAANLEAVRKAREAGDAEALFLGGGNGFAGMTYGGRVGPEDALFRAALEDGLKMTRDPLYRRTARSQTASRAFQRGEWDIVRESAEEVDRPGSFHLSFLMREAYERGRTGEAEGWRNRVLTGDVPDALAESHYLPVILASAGRVTGDPALFEDARRKAEGQLRRIQVACGLALVAYHQKDKVLAKSLYPVLLPRMGTTMGHATASSDHLLALLSVTMDNLADAERHFAEGIAFSRRAGYKVEMAWALHDYADMLLDRKGEGDKEKATGLLTEALAISRDLGMKPLMERVLAKREILKA